jgi:hypothetical protein
MSESMGTSRMGTIMPGPDTAAPAGSDPDDENRLRNR